MPDTSSIVQQAAGQLSAWGPAGAWALVAAGAVCLAAGYHLARAASAALAAGTVFVAVFVATSHLEIDRSTWLVAAASAGLSAVFALFAPRAGAFLSGLALGAAVGVSAAKASAQVDPLIGPVIGGMVGVVAAMGLHAALPFVVPPLLAGLLLASGLWSLSFGSQWPALFQQPAFWLAFGGVVTVTGASLERSRLARRDKRRERRTAREFDEARTRRDEAREKRYERYMQT